MNYMKIIDADSKNGDGFRTTLYVSGCDIYPHCDKCFNKEAWDFLSGKLFTKETKEEILYYLSKPYIKGLSILGGDPLSNVKMDNVLLDLVKTIKKQLPEKDIYVWTGFNYEDIIKNKKCNEFLKYIDVLRDGRYIDKLRDITQHFQGSTNQRTIDVKKSLKQNKIILINRR